MEPASPISPRWMSQTLVAYNRNAAVDMQGDVPLRVIRWSVRPGRRLARPQEQLSECNESCPSAAHLQELPATYIAMFKIIATLIVSAFVLLPLATPPAHSRPNSGGGPVGGLGLVDDGTGPLKECLGWCQEFFDQSIEMCMLNHPPEKPKGFFGCVETSMHGLNRCNHSCRRP